MNRLSSLLPLTLVGALALPSSALATFGLNPIAFEARSAGMGGADTAGGTSGLSMVRNPAAITRLGTQLDVNITLIMPSLTFSDEIVGMMTLNDGVDGEPLIFPLPGLAFATEVIDGLHVGLAVYAQGGAGADFKDLTTFADDDPSAPLTANPSPATYDTHSKVQYLRVAPTVAWAVSEHFSIGASLHIGLGQFEFKHGGMQFPEGDGDHVNVPHTLDFSSDWAVGLSGSLGLQASFLEDDLRFGASVTFGSQPKFEGTLKLDGQLEYAASTETFGWPLEISLGAAGRLLDDALTLAADFRFAFWSDSIDTVTFAADATGQAPPGYERLELPFMLDWRDRMTIALGAEYAAVKDTFFVRLGWAWSPSPVTSSGVNPLFPAVAEHHLTAGLGLRNFAGGLTLDLAVELALPNEVASDGDNQMAYEPAMPGATPSPNGYRLALEMSQFTVHFSAGWVF
jgi:long-chain fatty acid transport protein